MADQKLTPDIIARAEELVARIQGVSSCQISTDKTGEITEVHVVATAQKPPKLIARDVETCLKAEMGIRVDYKKIGVVVFDQKRTTLSAPHHIPSPGEEPLLEFPIEEVPSRFAFQSVNVFISHDGVKAEVELVRDELEAFGSAKSDNPSRPPKYVIAEATLKAVSEFLDGSVKLCLFDVLEVTMGKELAIVVRVDLFRGRQGQSLTGCSIVSGDINQTVVYATLDAVNRVLGKLRSKRSIEYRIE